MAATQPMDSDVVIFIGLLAATSRWYIHYANSTAYRDLQVSGDATAVGVVMNHVQTHSTVVLGSVLRSRYTPPWHMDHDQIHRTTR